jgi:hypothetical protein
VCATFHVIVTYLTSRQSTKLPNCLREYTIGYCDSYLYRLSRDRATLRCALAHLESEERRTQLARRRATNKKAAINRLPDDTLGEILLLSMLPSGKEIWSSPEAKTCHHWRRVARQTPRIWSCLYITREIPFECIRLWMTRSAEAPLHVHFDAPPVLSDKFFRPAWQRIMQHSHRFQSLFLRLHGSWWINRVLPATSRLNSLRELQIFLGDDVHSPSGTSQLDIFEPHLTTCRLRTLRIKTSTLLKNFFMMPSPAATSLVELTLEEQVAPGAVCQFLRECREIRKLKWNLRCSSTDTAWAPISISTLEYLWISGKLAAEFILAANLPSLRHLVVSHTYKQAEVCAAILGFTQITHLHVDFSTLDATNVRSIYESLHHLEHLSYPWCEDTFGAILVLAEWEEEEIGRIWHCPRMKRLHLHVGDRIDWERLQPATVRSCLEQVMRIRARSEDAPLEVILDDSEETGQFSDIGVQRVPLASFPTV